MNFPEYIQLLQTLIETPSLSGEEQGTASVIAAFFERHGVPYTRMGNNIAVRNRHYREGRPVLLLNSHHDTVKPNVSWTRNPFSADIEDGVLYGLGSNDAGASLVALMAAFMALYPASDLHMNLVFLASAEEENSGPGGIGSVLSKLGPVDCAIVGEPSRMQMAVAEKGLMVLDFCAKGKAGHAAREEGVNAIYIALRDIERLNNHRFERVSPLLGPVRLSVTCIQGGTQHNVVPDECRFTADIRSNELYTHEEILETINALTESEMQVRSIRLRPSFTPPEHRLCKAAEILGISVFGSPTLSDQALLPFPSVKIGPGDSARSHSADEFIRISEIEAGIQTYTQLIQTAMAI